MQRESERKTLLGWLVSVAMLYKERGRVGGKEWWGSLTKESERGLADCGGGGGLICSAVCTRSARKGRQGKSERGRKVVGERGRGGEEKGSQRGTAVWVMEEIWPEEKLSLGKGEEAGRRGRKAGRGEEVVRAEKGGV